MMPPMRLDAIAPVPMKPIVFAMIVGGFENFCVIESCRSHLAVNIVDWKELGIIIS